MSVTATSFTPELYTGNGSTTNFPVTFDYIASGDLVVNLIDTVTGGKTLQTLGVDYNVVNDEVVMVTAPASDEKLHITRVTPSNQLLNLINSHDFDAELVEGGFDKLTLKDQEVAETFGRAIKFALTSQYKDFDFPDPEALKLFRFNAAADGLEAVDIISAGGAVITSYMRTLLEDETAAEARTTLDAQQINAILSALAGLSPSADQIPYFTGASAMALTALTSFVRTILGSANASTAVTNLGILGLLNLWTKNQRMTEKTLTISSGNVAFNFENDGNSILTLTENAAFSAPTGMEMGLISFAVAKQDGTGSRTLSFHSTFDFAGGDSVPNYNPNKHTLYMFYCLSSTAVAAWKVWEEA